MIGRPPSVTQSTGRDPDGRRGLDDRFTCQRETVLPAIDAEPLRGPPPDIADRSERPTPGIAQHHCPAKETQ
jgi:hypothetical protein